jgi:hypothetical protein
MYENPQVKKIMMLTRGSHQWASMGVVNVGQICAEHQHIYCVRKRNEG